MVGRGYEFGNGRNAVVWQVVMVGQGVQTRAWSTLISMARRKEGVVTGYVNVLGCGIEAWSYA